MISLILGGARSGKSRYAQQLAARNQKPVFYIATASPSAIDAEMAQRIERHQADRPADWQLVEQATRLHDAIDKYGRESERVLLVDCLTLWLNNELYYNSDTSFELLSGELLRSLSDACCDVILVSNEVGMGIVPMGAITRQFVDWQGWLNQAVAKTADSVTFVAAGLPLILKETSNE